MNGKAWTDDELKQLQEMFSNGTPDITIAQLLGRSSSAIKNKRKKSGIQGDHNARRITTESRARMGSRRHGANHPSWKGGKRTTSGGYVEVLNRDHHRARGNGYVFEHIVIAEKKLGRSLLFTECVHHIDGDKTNNNPDNLTVMLMARHSGQHARLNSKKMGLQCPVCGNMFFVKQSQLSRRKTCSKSCAAKITLWGDRNG